jgi:tetratricopeptide (TPR) repeat protein
MSAKMFDYDSLHFAISELRSKGIFFIGGAVKSGTTWLQLLLDSHPDVSCNGEAHFPDYFAPLLQGALDEQNKYISAKNTSIFKELQGYPQFNEDHFRYLLTSAITLLLHEQAKHRSVRVIGEKTPNNIRFLELLDAMFPTAKVIQIVRDGRDCAVSGWFHNLRVYAEELRQNYMSMDDYVKDFAEVWRVSVSAGHAFGIQHPMRYLALRYEDMSANPEGTLERAFRFLGVDCSESIVRKCLASGSFEKVSGGRTRGQEDRDSFFRKGTAGDWHNHLSEEAQRIFEEKAGEWLTLFSYPHQGAVKPDASPAVAFQSALSLHQQGKFREAERLYRVVLRADRHDFHSLFNLGVMRAQQDRFEDAVKLLRRALAIEPNHPAARNNLRLAILARDKEASARGDESLSHNPQSTEAQIALHSASEEADHGEEVIASSTVAPDNRTAHHNNQSGRKERNRLAGYKQHRKKKSP